MAEQFVRDQGLDVKKWEETMARFNALGQKPTSVNQSQHQSSAKRLKKEKEDSETETAPSGAEWFQYFKEYLLKEVISSASTKV